MMMNQTDRALLINSYGNAYSLLIDALQNFPQEMWQFKPSPHRWSIHEIIIHIADSEANSYIRCRRLIAENGSGVLGYDQDRWANFLQYHQLDTSEYLELFKWLRKLSYDLIRKLPEEIWQHTIEHSENGVMTMEDWLRAYEAHIPGHIQQMQGNYEAWLAQNKH